MTSPEKRDVKLVSLLWAGPDTVADIAQIHAALFPEPWGAAGVAKLLEHPGATALVARTGFPKVSVGYVMGQIAADEAEILSVGVGQDWQRVGLGKKLIEGLERAVARSNVKRLFLEVAEDNAAARALYASRGFQQTGRRKGYYARKGGRAIDALVLSKALS